MGRPDARYSYVLPGTVLERIPAGRFCIGRNRRSAERISSQRLGVGEIAVHADDLGAGCDLAIGVGQHAGQVHLDAAAQLRLARDQPVDRLEEIHVRAREDVDAGRRAAEQAAERRGLALPSTELGVQVAGVDDAERVVRSRRDRLLEVGRIESVRDRDDRLARELREGLTDPSRRLRRAT